VSRFKRPVLNVYVSILSCILVRRQQHTLGFHALVPGQFLSNVSVCVCVCVCARVCVRVSVRALLHGTQEYVAS
jgi:hypothetical protein